MSGRIAFRGKLFCKNRRIAASSADVQDASSRARLPLCSTAAPAIRRRASGLTAFLVRRLGLLFSTRLVGLNFSKPRPPMATTSYATKSSMSQASQAFHSVRFLLRRIGTDGCGHDQVRTMLQPFNHAQTARRQRTSRPILCRLWLISSRRRDRIGRLAFTRYDGLAVDPCSLRDAVS